MWKFTARGHDRTVRNDFKINNSAAEKIFNVWQFIFDSICSTEWISICFKFVWNGGILVKMCHMYHACTYTQIIDLYTMQKKPLYTTLYIIQGFTHCTRPIQCVRFYTLCMNLYTCLHGTIHCVDCAGTYSLPLHYSGVDTLCMDLYNM